MISSPAAFSSMRKYPMPNSTLKVNPLHLAIVEAAEKGVDWDHVHSLLATLGEKGLIDPKAAWDENGRHMLGALMECRRSGYDSPLPEELLDLVIKLDPQALTRKDPGNNTPVDLFLDGVQSDAKSSRLRQTAAWWLQHAPRELLLGWVPKDRYGETTPPEPNGYHLLDVFLELERERDADQSLLTDLAQLGIDLNARNRKKNSPMTQIKHAAQWEAFLEHGGDPHVMVGGNEEKGPVPLWRYLVDRTYDGASKQAEKWAMENLGDTMKQKLYDDYWAGIRQKIQYGTSPSDIPSVVREHKDYLTLRDPQGRPVGMYVIQMHASAHKILQQKQYQEMNKLRDDGGYSLWHYALGKGKNFTSDTMRFLLESGAPLDPNPKTGRGLIPSLMLDFPHMHSEYDRYPRNADNLAKLLKKTTGEQWFAMQDGDWEKMKEGFAKLLGTKDVGPTLAYIACEFIDSLPNQEMRDQVMKINLDQYRNVNTHGVRRYFDLGYADHWSVDEVEQIKNKLGAEAYGEVRAIYDARQMQQAVPQVQAPRKGPRL